MKMCIIVTPYERRNVSISPHLAVQQFIQVTNNIY